MDLINVQTGKPESLETDAGLRALASGTHAPPKGYGLVLSPSEKLEFAPASEVPQQLESGYRIPDPSEVMRFAKEARYGKPVEELKSFGAGVARGATFGLSDIGLIQSGLATKQGLREREEFSPTTAAVAPLVGALGAAFIPGSPVGLLGGAVNAGEQALVKTAGSVLPKILAESALGKLAVKTGAKTLGSAIEGAAFGLGDAVSENALGDAKLTAQQVLAKTGMGAMYGGALGAALAPIGYGVGKTIGAARGAYNAVRETLLGRFISPIDAEAAAEAATQVGPKVTAAPKEQIPVGMKAPETNIANPEGIVAEMGEGAEAKTAFQEKASATGYAPGQVPPPVQDELGPFEKAPSDPEFVPGLLTRAAAKMRATMTGQDESEIIKALGAQMDTSKIMLSPAARAKQSEFIRDQLQTLLDTVNGATKRFYGSAREAEMKNVLEAIPINQAKEGVNDILNAGLQLNSKFNSNEKMYSTAMVATFDDSLVRALQNVDKADSSYGVFDAMNNFKREVDDFLGKKYEREIRKLPIGERNAYYPIREYISQVRNNLENPDIWGEMGARQSKLNNAVSEWISATNPSSNLAKEVMRMRENNKWEIDYIKFNNKLNMINDPRSLYLRRGLDRMWKAASPVIDALEQSYKNVPMEKFQAKEIRDLLKTSAENAINAKNYVAGTMGGYGRVTDLIWGAALGGPKGVAAAFLKGISGDPVHTAQTLAKLEKIASATTKAVDATSTYLFDNKNFAVKAAVPLIIKSKKETDEMYQEAVSAVKRFQNSDDMQKMLSISTEHLSTVAPNITQALQQTGAEAAQFLLSKMPKLPQTALFDTPMAPNDAMKTKFVRYYEALENPHVILDQLKENYVLPETIEALLSVLPEYLNYVKGQIVSEMTNVLGDKKLELPYARRITLSSFLGMPLDSSMKPEQMLRTQQTLMQNAGIAEAQEQAQSAARDKIVAKGSKSGAGKLTLHERTAPQTSNIATRE